MTIEAGLAVEWTEIIGALKIEQGKITFLFRNEDEVCRFILLTASHYQDFREFVHNLVCVVKDMKSEGPWYVRLGCKDEEIDFSSLIPGGQVGWCE